MRITGRITRWMALLVITVGLAAAVPASAQRGWTELETALGAGIASVQSIDAQPDAQAVVPEGGGRAPLEVAGMSSHSYPEPFAVDGPVFEDAQPNGIEVIADFVPESNAFYEVSAFRVVHTFKLSDTLENCEGLQEFAIFYAVAGLATFPAVEGLTTPDQGMTHATAVACTNAALRALHVQAAQLGTEFGTPHRIILATAPDPADPSKRCVYVFVVTENPDALVRPTLTTADDASDPNSYSFRQYQAADPEETTIAAQAGRPEVIAALDLAQGTADAVEPPEEPVEPPEEPVDQTEDPVDAIAPPEDEFADDPDDEEPGLGDALAESDEDAGSNVVVILVGVVVLGVLMFVAIRVYTRRRPGHAPVVPEPGRGPGDDSSEGDGSPALPADGPGGVVVRDTPDSPPLAPVPDAPVVTECDWRLRFKDARGWTELRPPGVGRTVCCTYDVEIRTTVAMHDVVRLVGDRRDDDGGREWRPAAGLEASALTLSATAAAHSEPTDSNASPGSVERQPTVGEWSSIEEPADVVATVTRDESTAVSVTLTSGCTDATHQFDASAGSVIENEYGTNCTNTASACDVSAAAAVTQNARVTGDVALSLDYESGAATTTVAPTDEADHPHDRPVSNGVSRQDATKGLSAEFVWSATFHSAATVLARQIVPADTWPTTQDVDAAATQSIAHDLRLSGEMAKTCGNGCACTPAGTTHTCHCEPAFELVIDGSDSAIVVDGRRFAVGRQATLGLGSIAWTTS